LAGGPDTELQRREARKRTERLVNFRDRSELELRQRLQRAGFPEAVVEREAQAAVAIGLVDDLRFTRLYIAGKKRSGWGRSRIENGLRRYGIDLRDTEGYPDAVFSSAEELERACLCLEGFKTAAKDSRKAAFRRLLSKGYSLEVAQRAVKASMPGSGSVGASLALADSD
jgi:regulatory protein